MSCRCHRSRRRATLKTNPLQKLQTQLGNLKGKLALVKSTGMYGDAMQQRPTQEYTPRRLGASPPRELVELRYQATASLLAVYGVSPSIMGLSQGGTGIAPAGQREAWRQFLHATVQPVARLVEQEATAKLGKPVTFSFDRLFASVIYRVGREPFNQWWPVAWQLKRRLRCPA